MSLTRELETLFFILIASIISLYAVVLLNKPKHFSQLSVMATLPQFVQAVLPTPTPTPFLAKTTTTSWTSSDGVDTLTMTKTLNQNLKTTYAFSLDDSAKNTHTSLFIQTIPGVSSMSIPFNTFSSDNSYIFLKETLQDESHYLVFKTSGETFADGKFYEDVTILFRAYTTTYSITDVTGWASGTLLVVNTKRQDGAMGPSFWLDAPSKSFILLSTHFD